MPSDITDPLADGRGTACRARGADYPGLAGAIVLIENFLT
jgi:hypothetical protein